MSNKFSKGEFVFAFFLLLIFSYFYLARLPKPVNAVSYTRNVFLQKANTSSFDFRWATDTQEQLIVKYGLTTSYGNQVTSDAEQLVNCGNNASFPCTGGSNNHAKITGLTPNTKYYYQVTALSGTPLTPAGDLNHYFETPPVVGSTTPFSWAIWGDSGTNSTRQNNVAKQVFAKKPDLVMVAGDIAYGYTTDFNNNNNLHFNHYSDATPGQNTMSFSPFYVTCGNHETSCPTVMADHSLPGGGKMTSQISTYSYDYGNVHFVALNSNGSYAYNATNPSASDPQVAWAYNDLRASNQPWKVVYWHHNGWSAGSHSTNTAIVDNLIRMSSDAGADIVLWGHSHVYERWNRVNGFYPNVQVYTIGNGGRYGSSGCTATSPGPGCAAKSSSGDSEAGFLFFEVNGNTMTARYITQSGANPDTITLTNVTGATPTPGTSPIPSPSPTFLPSPTPTPSPGSSPTPVPSPTPSGNIINFSPLADTYINSSSSTTNYGNSTQLYVDTGGPEAIAYLKYDLTSLAGRTIIDAKFQFKTTGSTNAGSNGPQAIKLVDDTSWSETILTYTNQPVVSTTVLGTYSGASAINTVYTMSLDPTIIQSKSGGLISLAMDQTTTDGLFFNSRETADAPQLMITLSGTPPSPSPGGIPGDANGDGLVNQTDYAIWLNHYSQTTVNGAFDGDFNIDTKVNGIDYALWRINYSPPLQSPNPSPSPTPGATPTFNPSPTPSGSGVNFQPSSPYYSTFYYQWYKTPATDGSWSYWQDHGNNPPNTWFSKYLPDPKPSVFDPATELYSANDYTNFKWQVSKMAEARQEVAIASWFGPGTKEDIVFNNVINSFMGRTDNPYPNLRWAMYYEDEGFSDPSATTLVADLNHIKNQYVSSPYFHKVGGKPVIFVYADAADSSGMAQRWKDANTQLGNYFYIVLKLYPGYTSDPNQPDSWHQYAPATRSGTHTPFSAYVSPGFFLDDGASAERLPRNATEFENAVVSMVSANVTWKMVQTWNEWGEGTSVEPGTSVRFNTSTNRDEPDPNGYPFENLYIDILNRRLPALEQGTGASSGGTVKAFYGAEGYGATSVGGRGGRVYTVTNLNDSGTGSLRACTEATGARTCVFDVSGTITLLSELHFNSFLTIAGQTAPGDGITLKAGPGMTNGMVTISKGAHDIIIRYIRSRPGPPYDSSGNLISGQTLFSFEVNGDHLIFDHVSASWSAEETFTVWYPEAHDITLQWSVISEGLRNSTHPQGHHSKGIIVGSGGNCCMSIHHNVIAHHDDRFPEIKLGTDKIGDIINNVIYDWGPSTETSRVTLVSDEYGQTNLNVIGNYYKPGPLSQLNEPELVYYNASGLGVRLFIDGNFSTANFNYSGPTSYVVGSRFDSPPITTHTCISDVNCQARDLVLANAGSSLPTRDAIDARIINDVLNGTGSIIDHPSQSCGSWGCGWINFPVTTRPAGYDTDNDGMADTWEMGYFGTLSRGNSTSACSSIAACDYDGDGYTDLEEFLNGTDPKI